MDMDTAQDLIRRYEAGPARLRAAWAAVPEAARQWRPGSGKWSCHEVVVHVGDSETMAAGRLRWLLAEDSPTIQGYDENAWARALDYHALDPELALAAVEAVHANTLPLLRRLTDADLGRTGTHTESGPYTLADWLKSYGTHIDVHLAQIGRNLEAWRNRE